jgi:tight adherence protein C
MALGVAAFAAFLVLARRGRAPSNAVGPRPSSIPRGRYAVILSAAGLVEPRARSFFMLIHAASTLAGVAAGAWLSSAPGSAITAKVVLVMLGALIGWWIPMSWIQGRATQRRVDMLTEFPIALDLLQIALEGGMGLDAAWADVGAQLSRSSGGLAQEMQQIELEVRFGGSWSTALAAASGRTGLAEFSALGSLLDQTERFGTEMARMIAVMSDSLRHEEVQALEERAHRASVMLLLPLAGLLLPGSLLLMFAPPFILLMEGIGGATP